ncbi:MAG: glycine C-acetyltransferase [Deltaproteobacteria bacterium]|nr:glycine C-acetyltransferase [Deltaproteobacteria bacterium]
MYDRFRAVIAAELASIRAAGLAKEERVIASPQGAEIVVNGKRVLNFCANNYLGLADHPEVIAAARAALDDRGYGMASVRFICGTGDVHKTLEGDISRFFGTDDTILYSSCFDANAGLFETLLTDQDAVVSDALNHASIIDGVRLCKAKRFRFAHADMADLDVQLTAARGQGARLLMIATDGVFSMDGDIADLAAICDCAERHGALVMIDDSHATGFMGQHGRGTPEHCGVEGRIDVLTSTLGKALGGASGGFTTGRKEIIDLLRNRSRPYLFSNTLAPVVVAASLTVLDLIRSGGDLRERLMRNTRAFREGMTAAGFRIRPGIHPIVPILLGEATLAVGMAKALLDEGIYVIGFSFPVVPKGQARIRVQLSAAHTPEHVRRAVTAFTKIGRQFGVLR